LVFCNKAGYLFISLVIKSISMKDSVYHSEPMANFLQVARYIVAVILIILSSWVFLLNIFSDMMIDDVGDNHSIHYLYTFVGYGMALLVFMMTPSGLIERGD
jgi:hypothetical protein